MIAHLTGKLIHKQPNTIIIDVAGVGYEVAIPLSTFYDLGELGDAVSLHIHTSVREDAIQLFGFARAGEKELFLKLTTVSGIGPKLGIAMLSGMAAADLIVAIKNNDLGRLTRIPGIGRKTAERLILELRDKLGAISIETETAMPAAQPGIREDTIDALIALGYGRPLAERAVDAALREEGEMTIEAVIKRSLKKLSR
ncbi:MAG TPA: Holliday junction branch migration protein RuvA [Blastocatellia bacterium]